MDYEKLRKFMYKSRREWNIKYPEFRAHYDGDKLEAYKLIDLNRHEFLSIPKIYLKLDSVDKLSIKELRSVGEKASAFVVKGNLGNQGRRVICLKWKFIHNRVMYRDILRSKKYNMTEIETLSYIHKIFKREAEKKGTALFIEEFIGESRKGLPQDYKLYVVNNKVKHISVFKRIGKDEYANSYNRDWQPVKMAQMYIDPVKLDYIENESPPDNLPNKEMREKLIIVAEELSKKHKTKFCRYDLYCTNDKIYFGEITPVCGDFNYFRLLDSFAKTILSND